MQRGWYDLAHDLPLASQQSNQVILDSLQLPLPPRPHCLTERKEFAADVRREIEQSISQKPELIGHPEKRLRPVAPRRQRFRPDGCASAAVVLDLKIVFKP